MKWLVVLALVALVAWAGRRQEVKDAEKKGLPPPPDEDEPAAGETKDKPVS